METKIKEYPIEHIEVLMEERETIAKKGSCKTCEFCMKDDGAFCGGSTYYCAIQGNVNGIWFKPSDFERAPYPWQCDEGRWDDTEICYAFVPKTKDLTDYHDQEIIKHRDYLDCLIKAWNLYYSIKHEKLQEYLTRLVTGDFTNYR